MSNKIIDTIANIRNKSERDVEPTVRNVWDPKGNQHCFNKGFGPAWYDRNGNTLQDEFHRDPMVLLTGAGGNFDVNMGRGGSLLPNGQFIETNPPTWNLHRADKPEVTLQVGVSANYSIKPNREIITIPDSVTIKAEDFENEDVFNFLQDQHTGVDLKDENIEIPVNELLLPAGCSNWQNGRKLTFQYFIGAMEPRPGDAHKIFLNIESAFDGSKATRYYLTVVRVVCENTQLHAEQDGWNRLTGVQKRAQRIRRTSKMDERIDMWHQNISNVLIGAVETAKLFKTLASTKIADSIEARKRIVEKFVDEAFNLAPRGSKTELSKRTQNLKDQILEDAIYEDNFGGGKCETLFDLWNGVTSWTQHFTQVNGLEKFHQKEEKRYFQLMTDSVTQQDFQSKFVLLKNMLVA